MKTFLRNIILIGLVLIFFGACNDVYDEDLVLKPYLECYHLSSSENQLFCTSEPQQLQFEVQSTHVPWRLKNGNPWFKLSPKTGTTTAPVQVKVLENQSADTARMGIFHLCSENISWNCQQELYVTQDKAPAYLQVSQDSMHFTGKAYSRTLEIRANSKWTARTREDWMTLVPDVEKGTLTVTVQANEGWSSRRGFIEVEDLYRNDLQISILQNPASISVSDAKVEFSNLASKCTLVMEAESDWYAKTSTSWLSVEPNVGKAGKHTLEIVATPNMQTRQRTGYVYFYVDGSQRTLISVHQKGLYIETSVEEIAVSSFEEKRSFELSSNTEWEITSYPEWVNLSVLKGEGNTTVEVSIADNPNPSPREGYIHIEQAGTNLSTNLRVKQEGKNMEFLQNTMTFGAQAGEQTASLVAELPWTLQASAAWLMVSPNAGGIGNHTIKVAVEENNTGEDRTGKLALHYGNSEQQVKVLQKSKYFVIDDDFFDFTSKGGVVNVSFTTDDEWTIQKDDASGWIKLSTQQGKGDAVVALTVADNPSLSKRQTEFYIETKGCRTTKIVVKQAARYLKTNVQSCSFLAHGGESELITVETDASYTMECSDTWFALKKKGNNQYQLEVTKNNASKSRKGFLTFTMTDLEKDTYQLQIPVLQMGEGGDFFKDDFMADENWDVKSDDSFKLKIVGFTQDEDWNKNGEGNSVIDKTVFGKDEELDHSGNGDSSIGQDDFPSDDDLNQEGNGDSSVDKDGFHSDDNWDDKEGGSSIDKDKYQPDNNLDNQGDGDSSIDKDGFKPDNDWNGKDDNGSSLDKEGFGQDENLDNQNNGNSTIGKEDFGKDENLDKDGTNDSSINKGGFSPDEDWNNDGQGNSTIGKEDFGKDENLDKDGTNDSSIDKGGFSPDEDWNGKTKQRKSKNKKKTNKKK